MKIAFRTDASLKIGTGHVMRCLTLAERLALQGHECWFVCRDHQGHLGELIASKGYGLTLLPVRTDNVLPLEDAESDDYAFWLGVPWQEDADQTLDAIATLKPDWLIVDHYALDAKWERTLATAADKIMVIDDLANRSHECVLLLDQNLGGCASDYDGFLPEDCQRLIGPHYALLRPEFAECREQSLKRRQHPKLKRILVSLGGIDQTNLTGEVLEALVESTLPASTELDIVLGAAAPYLDEVREQAARLPFKATVSVNVKNMAGRMCLADLSIGAAGGTSWERCCLGLPTVLVVLAENQVAGAKALEASGAAITIVDDEHIGTSLSSALADLSEPGRLERMSEAAASITDGNGVFRAVQAMSGAGGTIDG